MIAVRKTSCVVDGVGGLEIASDSVRGSRMVMWRSEAGKVCIDEIVVAQSSAEQ